MEKTRYRDIVVHYRENTSDVDVIDHSFDKDIFLTSIPYFKLKGKNVLVDIGAHIGTFSLLFAATKTLAKAYAIEPAVETYNVLEKNISENSLSEFIIPCKVALSDSLGESNLYHDLESGNWGHSISKKLSDSFEQVKTQTPDYFFESRNIKRCDLIKFNCEGAEFEIIESMSKTTMKKIRTWIILYHEDINKNGDHKKIINKLRNSGFIVNHIRVSDDGKRGWITATNEYLNYYKYSLITHIKKLFNF